MEIVRYVGGRLRVKNGNPGLDEQRWRGSVITPPAALLGGPPAPPAARGPTMPAP
jgi:hypothetical protein